VLDEDAHKIEVVVPDEQLSLAIGRRGQNVRLASMLTGWEIDILTERDESERRQAEFKSRSENFINALDVEDVIAHLLVTEGFTNVEEVAFIPIEELASIEGFDEGIGSELQRRARTYLEAENERQTQQARDLGVQDDLIGVSGLTPAMLVTLGERGIKTLEDFADLASDELSDPTEGVLRDHGLSESDANDIIMRARVAAGWFTEEELAATRAAEAARREAAAAQTEVEAPQQ
jgi:N utilization substance protein A